MALKIRARLLDSNQNPAANVVVEACFYNVTGQPYAIGSAASDGAGNLLIQATAITLTGNLPRVLLRTKVGTTYRSLSDTPVSYNQAEVNFGDVTVPAEKPTTFTAMKMTSTLRMADADIGEVQPVNTNISLQLNRFRTENLQLKNSLTERDTTINSLRNENTTLKSSVAERDGTLNSLKGENTTLKANLADRDKNLASLRSDHAGLQKQVESLNSVTATLRENLTRKEAEWANDKTLALKELDQKFQAALGQKDGEIASLRAAIDDMKRKQVEAEGAEVSLEELFEKAGKQIESASQRFSTEKNGYRLGKVSMQLKLLPGRSGMGVSFMKRDEIEKVPPDFLSVVNLEFNPRREEAPAARLTAMPVPDVVGYTRIMALRKLAAANFDYEIWDEVVPPAESQKVGQVLRQSPAGGEKADPGTRVILTIGRSS